jgi:hypothetical protein
MEGLLHCALMLAPFYYYMNKKTEGERKARPKLLIPTQRHGLLIWAAPTMELTRKHGPLSLVKCGSIPRTSITQLTVDDMSEILFVSFGIERNGSGLTRSSPTTSIEPHRRGRGEGLHSSRVYEVPEEFWTKL